MTRMTLDADFASRLQGVAQPVELCDPTGKVLGRFMPAADMSQWEAVTPDVTEEELDRRERCVESRYTTAEVLAHLENL